MEQRNKNQISTLLLVVGVIFILVAGSIFVTTAWQYLPEFVKQLTLLVIAAGLFAGSAKVSKGGRLQKSEMALFYLGAAFTGFFVLAAMGGLVNDDLYPQLNAFKMLMAGLVMLVPVGVRLWIRKKGFEYSVAAVLVDGCLIWLTAALELEFRSFALLSSIWLLCLAAVDYYRRKEGMENSGLELSVSIVYLVHAALYVPIVLESVVEAFAFGHNLVSILFAMVPVLITGITYMAEKQTVYRILNSVAIVGFVYVLCSNLNFMLSLPEDFFGVLLAAFIINTLIMLLAGRKELQLAWIGIGLLNPFIQWFFYMFMLHTERAYYPFSFVFAVGLVLLYYKSKYMDYEEEISSCYGWSACLQVLTGIIMWVASTAYEFSPATFFILVVITLVTVAFWVQDQTAKSILWTIALCFGEFAVWTQKLIEIPADYQVEWVCTFLGLGIVLLPLIWYDKNKDLEMMQFIMTCWLLGVLLLHNLSVGELGNVLFLGMVSIAILLVAAVKNQRKYVIAASVTLILLVLYLTRNFWLSIAWWVYLFAAGVVLVLLAIKKEREA